MVRPTAILALWILFTSCTGCAMGWTKPGATEPELNADKFSCEQEAVKLYPVMHASTSHYRPPPASKLDPNCVQQSGFSNCDSTGNVGSPSPAPQADMNDYNRAAAVKACLSSKGYTYKKVKP